MRALDARSSAARPERTPRSPATAGVVTESAARPGLPYQYALDYCALLAWAAAGRTSVVTASTFFTHQLSGRLGEQALELIWMGGRPVPGHGEWAADIVAVPARKVETVIWANPEGRTAADGLRAARRALAPGGCLVVIVAGPLGRLAARRPEGEVAQPGAALGMLRLLHLLRGASLTVEEIQGYGGVASYLWGYAGQAVARLGRGDLADRCQVRHREGFVVGGLQAAAAPLAVVVARGAAAKAGAEL